MTKAYCHFYLECLTTLYRALIYSPLDATQIPTLFFLSETILYWVKNDAVLEPFLTSTELKLLKVRMNGMISGRKQENGIIL